MWNMSDKQSRNVLSSPPPPPLPLERIQNLTFEKDKCVFSIACQTALKVLGCLLGFKQIKVKKKKPNPKLSPSCVSDGCGGLCSQVSCEGGADAFSFFSLPKSARTRISRSYKIVPAEAAHYLAFTLLKGWLLPDRGFL